MFAEDFLIPISALQHYVFCPRQCALIHAEQLWAENRLTIEGSLLHSKAHQEGKHARPRSGGRSESTAAIRTIRGLYLRSLTHGLIGRADVVELHPFGVPRYREHDATSNVVATAQPGAQAATEPLAPARAPPSAPAAQHPDFAPDGGPPRQPRSPVEPEPEFEPHLLRATPAPSTSPFPSSLRPHPVEYKRGRPKKHSADTIQLCAQALCLEEMMGVPAPHGSIYYAATKHRLNVDIDDALRTRTLEIIAAVREMLDRDHTPRARREKKCDRCSLLYLCLPGATGPERSASRYLARSLALTGSADSTS